MAILLAELVPVVSFARSVMYSESGMNELPTISPIIDPVIDSFAMYIVFFVLVTITTKKINLSGRFPQTIPGANLLKVGIAIVVIYYIVYVAVATTHGGWGDIVIMFYSPLVTKWPAFILIFIGMAKALLSASPNGHLTN
jgi:hypothetical protein